ncbi:DUF6096 family protein [Clostridium gasigenes]|uniref:Phage tail assembly chaperone protein, TAC n=1 Tax=Clostridium gasigenes TaxID=94869 RepID=A0A7X0VT36_9CLOT|nr:DUF6096 family protein [Clostridium gasigenes]MBB6716370.1 hypothetical protein [Clostridium gasigenes]
MKYTEFKVGEKEYKLKLGAAETISVEKKLGANLLNMFIKAGKDELPKLGDILIVLHGAMQKYTHGTTLANVYDLYDEYIDNDGSYMDLISVLTEVLQDSGFFKKVEEAPQEIEAVDVEVREV